MPPETRAELAWLLPHGGAVCPRDTFESRNKALVDGRATTTVVAGP
jgi:hypothetical protein